jgi:MarR family transcriptional regulator for hemolysin
MSQSPEQSFPAFGRTETEQETEEWRLLSEAFTLLRKETDRALAPLGTSSPQVYVLAILDVLGRPLPLTVVADVMRLESPTVTRLVDRMTRRGLVERLPDSSDRRRALVAATDRGRELLEQVRGPIRDLIEETFGGLSPRERASFKRLIGKFIESTRRRAGPAKAWERWMREASKK